MRQQGRYYFYPVQHCNMCGDASDRHPILGQRLNRSQGFRPRTKTGITTTIQKCSRCGLIYANPQPVPFDLQDHYGVPPEDYWKPEYFQYDAHYFSQELATLRQLMTIQPGMKAMDIGAGLGKCMLSLAGAGFDAYGFEGSESFHQRALERMKIDPSKLKQGTMENVSYEPETFDFITFGAVLEHLYDPAQSIAKAVTWLKPGGIMHIEVPSSRYLISRLINTYYKLIATNYVTNLSPMHEPYHLFEFGLRSFEEHAQKTGYTIVLRKYYVCSMAPFPRFLHPLLSYVMEKTGTGMQLAVWLKKNDMNTHRGS